MKCVQLYSHRELATDAKLALRSSGIEAKVVVDALESIAPALSPFKGVGLMVADQDVEAAARILRQETYKKAS